MILKGFFRGKSQEGSSFSKAGTSDYVGGTRNYQQDQYIGVEINVMSLELHDY